MSVLVTTKLTYQEFKLLLQAMNKHKLSRYAILRKYVKMGLIEEFGEDRIEGLDGAKKKVEETTLSDIIASQQVRQVYR